LLKPTGFESPFWGKVQEIRDAVLDFKKSGKPIYAYVEYGGDREYYLATAADKIYMQPSAPLNLVGVATYEVFLRGTLDKIGAYPDLHHIGDYKTAVNTFTEKTYTAAHKEMDESLNRDLYEQIVRGIADGRKKNEGEIRQLIDQGPFLPEEALRAGLIDDVAYEDQVDEKLRAGQPRQRIDSDDYARISIGSLGMNRGRNRRRPKRLRSAERRGRRVRHAHRLHPPGAQGQLAARDRAAHRQPRRIGDRLGRHLARAADCEDRARRSSAGRIDVRSRGLWRLLHRHAGAGHRRAAVDADRIDWDFRGQGRHRRGVRKARGAHRVDEHRQERRDRFAGAAVQARRSEKA